MIFNYYSQILRLFHQIFMRHFVCNSSAPGIITKLRGVMMKSTILRMSHAKLDLGYRITCVTEAGMLWTCGCQKAILACLTLHSTKRMPQWQNNSRRTDPLTRFKQKHHFGGGDLEQKLLRDGEGKSIPRNQLVKHFLFFYHIAVGGGLVVLLSSSRSLPWTWW